MNKQLESKQICKGLEKGELHVHLNGLFNTALISDIIKEENATIPSGFRVNEDLNVLEKKASLIEYLKPWDALRLIPKKRDNLSRLVKDAFKFLREDNVCFVELRSSIIYLSLLFKKTLDETLIILLEELHVASTLYKVPFGLIMTISRSEYSLVHLNSLMEAYVNIGKPKEIVGLDLAGDEDYPISKDIGTSLRDMKYKHGLKLTIHAGETGSVQNINDAIDVFHADRIGHATAAAKSLETMHKLKEKNICVELCPISNRRTGAIREFDSHPVLDFIKHEVPFVICSDNPGIHKAPLTEDYVEFLRETGRHDVLDDMFKRQKQYSFIK